MELVKIVDVAPEIPYFIAAAVYWLSNGDRAFHVFAVGFLFLGISVIAGGMLKLTFKTKRPVEMWNVHIFRYGFPSIHTMIAIGVVSFLLFVDPLYALVLSPLGLYYPYSRIKLKVHTLMDVIGGAVIGAVIGLLTGFYLLPVGLGRNFEIGLSALIFIIPLGFTIARTRAKRI